MMLWDRVGAFVFACWKYRQPNRLSTPHSHTLHALTSAAQDTHTIRNTHGTHTHTHKTTHHLLNRRAIATAGFKADAHSVQVR